MPTTTEELIIKGGKSKGITIKPTADNEYAPVKWEDQDGNNVAMIVAHEKSTNGKTHNHLSIYTCGKDRKKRVSRVDMQFGTDDPILSFEHVRVRFKGGKSQLELRSENGTYFAIRINDEGRIYTERV